MSEIEDANQREKKNHSPTLPHEAKGKKPRTNRQTLSYTSRQQGANQKAENGYNNEQKRVGAELVSFCSGVCKSLSRQSDCRREKQVCINRCKDRRAFQLSDTRWKVCDAKGSPGVRTQTTASSQITARWPSLPGTGPLFAKIWFWTGIIQACC